MGGSEKAYRSIYTASQNIEVVPGAVSELGYLVVCRQVNRSASRKSSTQMSTSKVNQ